LSIGNYWGTPSGILYLNLFNQVAKIGCGQMSHIAEYDMADQLTICHVSYPAQFSSDVGTLEDFSIAFLSPCSIASDLPQFTSGPPQEGGRNRQNDSEDGSYGLAVLVEKISEPEHAHANDLDGSSAGDHAFDRDDREAGNAQTNSGTGKPCASISASV
jgi:hypothetical protein